MLLRRDRCRQFAIFSGSLGYVGSLYFVTCVSDLAAVLTDATLAERRCQRASTLSSSSPPSRCILDAGHLPRLLACHEVSPNGRPHASGSAWSRSSPPQVPAECPCASSDPPETVGENDALGAIEGERMHIGNADRHVGDCLAPAMRSNSLARWLRGRPVQVGDVTLIALVGGLGTRARFS